MSLTLPQNNSTIVPVAFGVGLMLSGRYLLGAAAIAIGAAAYFKFGVTRDAGSANASHVVAPKPKNSESHLEEPPPIDNWYYEKDGAVIGPLLETQVRELMKNDEISNETLVFNSTLGDEWRTLDDTHFIKRNHHRGY